MGNRFTEKYFLKCKKKLKVGEASNRVFGGQK